MQKKKRESIAICLNCYKIRFSEKNKSKEKTVTEVFGQSLIEPLIKDFVKKIDSRSIFKNKAEDRILYLKEGLKLNKKENYYAGVIMKGHNGPQTSIDEVAGSQVKTVGTVSKDQFHCLPYLFMLYLNPEKPNYILFIAQSYRQFGFKEVFEECFREFTLQKSSDTTVNFNTLSVASLFEKQISDGFIKSIRLIKHGLSANAEAIVKGDKLDKSLYEMELKIKAKKGFWKIKERLKYDNASFIEQVKVDGFEFEEAYADVIVAGRSRSMNITSPSEFSAAYDITEEVRLSTETRLPNFKDVLAQAVDILKNDLIPYV